jgi:cobalt/nickel transport system ATP-binding protein
MSECIFKLESVRYSYLGRFPALCGVDLEVKNNNLLVLLGANGSGKTSLLHMLDGLIFPDAGSIEFTGRKLSEAAFTDEGFTREFRSKVGFVFQNSEVQLFSPTVKEDILFGPLQLGLEKEEIKKRLEWLVDSLKLEDLLGRAPHHLSTGEKRKVAIAATLIIGPDVLILDEPTAGLDPASVRNILDIIISFHEQGKTIITATHDLHIVEEIGERICILSSDKKIVRFGRAKELLSDFKLLEDNNLVHIHTHKHKNAVHTHPHEHPDHYHEA